MIYGWSPQIGDPTLYGWVTVVAYLAATLLAYGNFRHARSNPGSGGFTRQRVRAQRRFWLVMAVILLALGINKQLDLQSLLTAVGRHLAEQEGWYAQRHGIQREFIGVVVIAGLCAIGAAMIVARRAGGWAVIAVIGLGLLATFIVVRAASFHRVDLLIHSQMPLTEWSGMEINHLLELGGIAIIAAGAIGARTTAGRAGSRRSRARRR